MITPQQCDGLAEAMIETYCRICGCSTPDEVRNAGEMLISKMSRGIEKYAGNDAAATVLNRTLFHIAKPGGAA